jgi:hypothetical protein
MWQAEKCLFTRNMLSYLYQEDYLTSSMFVADMSVCHWTTLVDHCLLADEGSHDSLSTPHPVLAIMLNSYGMLLLCSDSLTLLHDLRSNYISCRAQMINK